MKFDQAEIEKVGFDNKYELEKRVKLPDISRISVFRRTTPPAAGRVALIKSRNKFNCHEQFVLWIMWQERGMLVVSDHSHILETGEAMLVMPGQGHVRVPLGKGTANWLLIRFYSPHCAAFEKLRNVKITLSEEDIELLNSFLKMWNSSDAGQQNALMVTKLQLLLLSMQPQSVDNETAFSVCISDNCSYVRELCELMMVKKIKDDPFEIVAKKWSVTPEYLRAVFRKKMGHPARYFLVQQRRCTARALLIETTLSISDIALATGFKSVYAFSRFFHNQYGMPPREYRKKYNKDTPVSIVL